MPCCAPVFYIFTAYDLYAAQRLPLQIKLNFCWMVERPGPSLQMDLEYAKEVWKFGESHALRHSDFDNDLIVTASTQHCKFE